MTRQELKPQEASGDVSSLINGVSQQPPNIRFPGQADECVNMMPTVQKQLGRRPPLETIFKLSNLAGDVQAGHPMGLLLSITNSIRPYTHWYRRDASEAYCIIMTGTDIKVYSYLDGTEKTVKFAQTDGDNYHLSDNPTEDFSLFTFKDVTFIVNRSKTPQMAYGQTNTPMGLMLPFLTAGPAGISPERNPECLIVIKDAVNLAAYSGTVTIGGTVVTIATVNATATDTTATIAGTIVSNITAAVNAAGATIQRKENVIHITHPTLPIKLQVSDNRAGTAITGFTNSVLKTTDLPAYAPNGYQCKVTGSTSSTFQQDKNTVDDVYYRFQTSDGSAMAGGTWTETIAPGIPYTIDSALMPHRLTRQSDGTFVFQQIDWEDRSVGDESSSPDPLFVGFPIHSMFISNNRLGLLAGGSFSLSRVDELNWFNHWKTTILTALDTDPVYGNITSSQVNKVYWAIQWNGELIVFGDSVDGTVSWQTTMAQSKISIDTPTHFGGSPLVRPLPSGNSLFFPKNRGNFSLLYEYRLNPVTSLKGATNLTSYIGSYLPKDIIQLVGLDKDFLVMLADGDRTKLYPYNYFRGEDDKLLQQAFHRWEFNENVIIHGIFLDTTDSLLYVLYKFQDDWFIGTMDVTVGGVDGDFPDKCYMDCRIDETQVTSVTYNSTTNRTTITLPWSFGNETTVLELRETTTIPGMGAFPPGYLLQVESRTSTTIVVVGDWSEARFFVGLGFESYYDPCKFYMYKQNSSGGSSVIADSWKRITVKRLLISYANTGAFKVQTIDRVTGTVIAEKELTLTNFDDVTAAFDDYQLYTGEKIVPISKPQGRYKVRLLNSTTRPSYFTSLSWLGEYWDGKA
jgi:hypothetical protein